MDTIKFNELQEPFDIGAFIKEIKATYGESRLHTEDVAPNQIVEGEWEHLHLHPFVLSDIEQAWMKQQEQNTREIAEMFGIPAVPVCVYTSNTTAPAWVISPKTYESIKLAHNFPDSVCKLRKVHLRRIANRKRAYRQHRIRVNAAIKRRLGVRS